jgi:hypothetical protein
LLERYEGISSSQIPFTLEAWSRTQDWTTVRIDSTGGLNLIKEMVLISKALGIPLKAFSRTTNAVELPSTPPDASDWINYKMNVRRTTFSMDKLLFRLSFKSRLQGASKSTSYIISLGRDVTSDMQLRVGDPIRIFLDFWTYDSQRDYRILVSKKETD